MIHQSQTNVSIQRGSEGPRGRGYLPSPYRVRPSKGGQVPARGESHNHGGGTPARPWGRGKLGTRLRKKSLGITLENNSSSVLKMKGEIATILCIFFVTTARARKPANDFVNFQCRRLCIRILSCPISILECTERIHTSRVSCL